MTSLRQYDSLGLWLLRSTGREHNVTFKVSIHQKGSAMSIRNRMAALTALISLGGAAQADILAAGPVYGGNIPEVANGQSTFTCRVFNAGLAPVTINLTQMWVNTGTTLTPASNTCLATPLASTKTCAFSAVIPGNFAVSCRINANGFDNNISGTAEVTGSNGRILNAAPLQK